MVTKPNKVSIKKEFFYKMHHRIPFSLALRLSVPLDGIRFVKTLATLKLLMQRIHFFQNICRIVSHR